MEKIKELEPDNEIFTHIGSMNYIIQVWKDSDEDITSVAQYQPRHNKLVLMDSTHFTQEEIKRDIKETMERMKIAINLFQEFLDGERDHVYYWERR